MIQSTMRGIISQIKFFLIKNAAHTQHIIPVSSPGFFFPMGWGGGKSRDENNGFICFGNKLQQTQKPIYVYYIAIISRKNTYVTWLVEELFPLDYYFSRFIFFSYK